MRQWVAVSIAGAFCLCSTLAMADELAACHKEGIAFFKKCLVFGGKDEQLPIQQQLYILENRSKRDLILDHPHLGGSAQAGWVAELAPGEWSALAIAKPDFAVTCYKRKREVRMELPCQRVLTVCALPQAIFPQRLAGASFWVAQADSWSALDAAIKKRGITWPELQALPHQGIVQ
jgi:hypothetical protein